MSKYKETYRTQIKKDRADRFPWRSCDLVSLTPDERRGLSDREVIKKLKEKSG